jgi:hypothetical protein
MKFVRLSWDSLFGFLFAVIVVILIGIGGQMDVRSIGFYVCIAVAAWFFGGCTVGTLALAVREKRRITIREFELVMGGGLYVAVFGGLGYLLVSTVSVSAIVGVFVGVSLAGCFFFLQV